MTVSGEESDAPMQCAPSTELVDFAADIAYDLVTNAKQLQDKSITWSRGTDRTGRQVTDAGIFDGRCGEALFLAAVHAATGDKQFEDASLRAVHTLRSGAGSRRYVASLTNMIGPGLTGIGSIVYAFLKIGAFLSHSKLHEEARMIVSALDPRVISTDHYYSVMWGTAGAILGLLPLIDAGQEEALELAVAGADHLIASRTEDPMSGLLAWPGDGSRGVPGEPIGGFAHGTGGIAYSLLELHRRCNNLLYYEAAMDAWTCERQWLEYAAANGQTPNPRYGGTLRRSWCRGSVGMGLSRLAALSC
ncbi:MAG: lanthionine synthetase LanC family protein, partial [Candidatus Binatia bacterium]